MSFEHRPAASISRFFNLMLILLAFFTTPTTLTSSVFKIEEVVNSVHNTTNTNILPQHDIKYLSNIIPSLLHIFYGCIIQHLVKLHTVKFGGWHREMAIPLYIIYLFSWSYFSTVALPLLAIKKFYWLIEFAFVKQLRFLMEIIKPIIPLMEILDFENWKCFFGSDPIGFFLPYIIISIGIRNHLCLHRVFDKLWEFLQFAFHRYGAVRNVHLEEARHFNSIKNGENMSLAEDYVWILLHFSVLTTFSISYPSLAPAFMVYIVTKHLIDVENFRRFYTTVGTQSALLRTSLKINLVCGLFPQFHTFIYFIYFSQDSPQVASKTMVSGAITIFHILLFMIAESSGQFWSFPILSKKKRTNIAKVEPEYMDPLFNTDLVAIP